MKLTKSELLLLNEIFTKVKYDKLNDRYTIALEDYAFLNLSGSQQKLLSRMCAENDIFLEKLPTRLTTFDTNKLFEEYYRLQEQIQSSPNSPNNKELEEMMIEIRNKIVIGHMRLVHNIINKSIPDFQNRKDKEDIYQLGYETLIEFVDKYDLTKEVSFAYFVKNYIMHYIYAKILRDENCLNSTQIEHLNKLNTARKKLATQNKKETIENLAQELGVGTKQVTNTLLLEKYLSTQELDVEKENNKALVDYDFEDRILDDIMYEYDYIHKLIDFLPPKIKTVIKLYYGFENGKTHTYDEISEKVGNISRERVRQFKEIGLGLLANSVGSGYLKDIYGTTDYCKKRKEGIQLIAESQIIIQDLLIQMESVEDILDILKYLNPLNREILLLYYGIKDGNKYDIDEISQMLGIRKSIVIEKKKSATELLIKGLAKKYNPKFKGNYLEYLMNKHLNATKTNTNKR